MNRRVRCKYDFPHPLNWDVGQIVTVKKKIKEGSIRRYVSEWGKRYDLVLSVFKEPITKHYAITCMKNDYKSS